MGGVAGRTGQRENRLSESFFCVIDGMVGNFFQLHQLQELVEHLLRSSQKKVEWSQYLVEWSGVCWGVWVFFLRVEPNLMEWSSPKHPLSSLHIYPLKLMAIVFVLYLVIFVLNIIQFPRQ